MANDIPQGGVPPVAPIQPIARVRQRKPGDPPPEQEALPDGDTVRDAVAGVAPGVIVHTGEGEEPVGGYDRRGQKT